MAGDDFLIGVLIGLILTLTGAGGSIVASPLLVYFGAISINDATGLTLATVCISAACLSFYGYCRGMFPVRIVAMLAVSGMLAAPFARLIVEQVDSRLMGVLFSLMALFFSAYYLFGEYISDIFNRYFKANAEQSSAPPGAKAMFAWGSLAGGLSGFFGIGGGIILMPVVMKVLRVPASRGVYY
nr:sulfite exporter TauE/SafE family protein [Gammaproteobacteria bacterium]